MLVLLVILILVILVLSRNGTNMTQDKDSMHLLSDLVAMNQNDGGSVTLLGFKINAVSRRISIPKEKCQEILSLLDTTLKKGSKKMSQEGCLIKHLASQKEITIHEVKIVFKIF